MTSRLAPHHCSLLFRGYCESKKPCPMTSRNVRGSNYPLRRQEKSDILMRNNLVISKLCDCDCREKRIASSIDTLYGLRCESAVACVAIRMLSSYGISLKSVWRGNCHSDKNLNWTKSGQDLYRLYIRIHDINFVKRIPRRRLKL